MGKSNKAYCVEYKMWGAFAPTKQVTVLASSKADAYNKAVFEKIPQEEGMQCYSAWVRSVTYQNGNHQMFNTFEGKPY